MPACHELRLPHTPDETVLLIGGDLCRQALPLLEPTGATRLHVRRSPAQAGEPFRIQADLNRPETLAALPPRIDRILCAVSPDGHSEAAYVRAFIEGPRTLIQTLRNNGSLDHLKRLVFVSSTAVYGEETDWVDESTPERPARFNGRVLLQAEQALAAALGDRCVVIRPSGLYGPGRTWLLDRLRSGLVQVADHPVHWANRLHSADAARACVHLLYLDQPAPVYIATDDTPLPLTDLYDALADLLNVPRPSRSGAPLDMPSKRLRATRLKNSGFRLLWPNTLEGYKALIKMG